MFEGRIYDISIYSKLTLTDVISNSHAVAMFGVELAMSNQGALQ
jgi:hypothetical protein